MSATPADVLDRRDPWCVVEGDCRDVLATLPESSIDAIVCDPPYDLVSASRGGSSRVAGTGPYGRHMEGTKGGGFMGQEWDATGVAFDPATWRAAQQPTLFADVAP